MAPTAGEIRPLTAIQDEAYAGGHLGPGFAVRPDDGLLRAPISGIVRKQPRVRHAVYLETDDGAQVLVHVGVNAHALRGLGFEILVEDGQRVEAGDPVLTADLEVLRIAGLPTEVAVVLVQGAPGQEVRPLPLDA